MQKVGKQKQQWTGRTDGKPWMHSSLIWLMRFLPVQIFYGVMDIVVIFYLLFAKPRRQAACHYWQLIHGKSVAASWWHTYLHFRTFGKAIVDRFAAYAGRTFRYTLEGNEAVEDAMSRGNGCILLASHIGNYEMAGYALQPSRPMYAVMFGGEKEHVLKNRQRLLEQNDIHILTQDDEMGYIYAINNILNNGDMLTLFADRHFGSDKSIVQPVMGKEASLPKGPFAIAQLYPAATVVCTFVMKESTQGYRVVVRRLQGKTAKDYATAYAQTVTEIVTRYPYQWYNFYEFWKKD